MVAFKLERLFQILLQQVYDRIPPENDAVQRYEQLDSRIIVEKMRVLVQQNVMQLASVYVLSGRMIYRRSTPTQRRIRYSRLCVREL